MTDRKTALPLAFALVIFALPAAPGSADEVEAPTSMENIQRMIEAFTPAEPTEPEEPAEPIDYGRSSVYLELDGHVTVPIFRRGRNGNVSGGPGARAGWRVAGPFAVELQYQWNANLESDPANLITVNGKILVFTEKRIQPFVRIGLGAIFGDRPDYPDMKSSFVARFGLGADYWVNKNWAATFFGDFVLPTDHFADLTHFNIGSGVRYRF